MRTPKLATKSTVSITITNLTITSNLIIMNIITITSTTVTISLTTSLSLALLISKPTTVITKPLSYRRLSSISTLVEGIYKSLPVDFSTLLRSLPLVGD